LKPSATNVFTNHALWLTPINSARSHEGSPAATPTPPTPRSIRPKSRMMTSPTPCAVSGMVALTTAAAFGPCHCTRAHDSPLFCRKPLPSPSGYLMVAGGPVMRPRFCTASKTSGLPRFSASTTTPLLRG